MPRLPAIRRAVWTCALGVAMVTCDRRPAPIDPPVGPVVVVANQEEGVATLIELQRGRLVAHVDVDMDPHEGAASPDGRYVALVGPSAWLRMVDANAVAIVDVQTASLAKTINLGEYAWPHGIAFHDQRTLLVSSRAKQAVAFVDIVSGQIQAVADNGGSRPYLLHRSRDGGRIYTSNPESGTLTEIDAASRRLLRTFPLADGPAGFTVSPSGDALWVATWTDDAAGAISVLDLATGRVATRIEGFTQPRRLAFASDGARVAITDRDYLRVFDGPSRREVGRVHLGDGAGASGVAFAPDSHVCYVAVQRLGVVAEIDTDRLTVLRRFDVGEGADGIVYVNR